MKHTNCDLSQLRDVAGGGGRGGGAEGGRGRGRGGGAGGGAEGVNLFPVLCTPLIQLEGALKHEIHPYCCSPQLLCFAPIFLTIFNFELMCDIFCELIYNSSDFLSFYSSTG